MNIKRWEHTTNNIHIKLFTALLNSHMDKELYEKTKCIENVVS